MYVDVGEEIPSNSLRPGGKPVLVLLFVDYDHAGDITTL